jgi:hypothetical protein
MAVVIKRSDSVSVLSGQVGPTDRDIGQFCIETLTVDLLIPLVQVHGVDGFTRVSVASAEKNYRDGNCGDRDLEEAAHLKRVVGVSFGRNSTDVLFEWAVKKSVLMGSRCGPNATASIVSRVGNWGRFNSCYLLDSRAPGALVRRAAESIVTLRLGDAVETPPATETNRCFRLWAVPPVKGGSTP